MAGNQNRRRRRPRPEDTTRSEAATARATTALRNHCVAIVVVGLLLLLSADPAIGSPLGFREQTSSRKIYGSDKDPLGYIANVDAFRFGSDTTTSSRVFFDDEKYLDQQWVFDMIDLGPVWSQGIYGKGVRVRINDGGMDAFHAEFRGRYDWEHSCVQKPKTTTTTTTKQHNDNQKEFQYDPYQHGTSVASIIGAAANNGECAVGVAPETILSWCDGLELDESFLDFSLQAMDISQNSYERDACKPFPIPASASASTATTNRTPHLRTLQQQGQPQKTCPFVVRDADPSVQPAEPCSVCSDFSSQYYFDKDDSNSNSNSNSVQRKPKMSSECVSSIVRHCRRYFKREEQEGSGACSDFLDLIIGGECSYEGLSQIARTSISNGIHKGRNGLGIIYVFASGNAYTEGDDTNLKGYTTSRHTISVGAVGKDKLHAYYSTSGASLFLSAPGGDSEDLQKQVVARAGGGCTTTTIGTSFASPVVSGVIALMLEVNPLLGWRDVQGILAESARPVSDPNDTTQVVNGAELWHSNLYGFGIVNANQAVELAKTWKNYGEETVQTVNSGPLNYPIRDQSTEATISSLTLSPSTQDDTFFVVESVELLLDVAHMSRGDLKITLVSPSGTHSVLHPGKLPENLQQRPGQFWKLMTVRARGESPFGEWKLHIADEKDGQFEECVDVPDFFLSYEDVMVTCKYLEKFNICGNAETNYARSGGSDGNTLNRQYLFLERVTDDKGRSVSDACCICGGGMERETVGEDRLIQWTIAVYGRSDPSKFVTSSPTRMPTTITTTTSPSSNDIVPVATNAPTATPSQQPIDPLATPEPSMIATDSPSTARSSNLPSLSSISFTTLQQTTTNPTTENDVVSDDLSPSLLPSSPPRFTPHSLMTPSIIGRSSMISVEPTIQQDKLDANAMARSYGSTKPFDPSSANRLFSWSPLPILATFMLVCCCNHY